MCISVVEAKMRIPRRGRGRRPGAAGHGQVRSDGRCHPRGECRAVGLFVWQRAGVSRSARFGRSPLCSGKPPCLEYRAWSPSGPAGPETPGAPQPAERRVRALLVRLRCGSRPPGGAAGRERPRVPREAPRRGHGGAGRVRQRREGGGRREDVPAQVRHGGGSGRTGFGSAFPGLGGRLCALCAAPARVRPDRARDCALPPPAAAREAPGWASLERRRAAGTAEIPQSREGKSLFRVTPRFWFAVFETRFFRFLKWLCAANSQSSSGDGIAGLVLQALTASKRRARGEESKRNGLRLTFIP